MCVSHCSMTRYEKGEFIPLRTLLRWLVETASSKETARIRRGFFTSILIETWSDIGCVSPCHAWGKVKMRHQNKG